MPRWFSSSKSNFLRRKAAKPRRKKKTILRLLRRFDRMRRFPKERLALLADQEEEVKRCSTTSKQ